MRLNDENWRTAAKNATRRLPEELQSLVGITDEKNRVTLAISVPDRIRCAVVGLVLVEYWPKGDLQRIERMKDYLDESRYEQEINAPERRWPVVSVEGAASGIGESLFLSEERWTTVQVLVREVERLVLAEILAASEEPSTDINVDRILETHLPSACEEGSTDAFESRCR